MLVIRLQRIGKKHDPNFRVVLADSKKSAKSGKVVDFLGSYNAQKGEPQLNGDKIKEWISKGAQVSDTVNNLLVNAKIIDSKKKDVLHHTKIKNKKAKTAPAVEATPATAPVVEAAPAVEVEAPVVEVVAVEEAPVVETPAAEVDNV